MYRHHPQTHKLKEVAQSGVIGELRQLRAEFSFMLDEPTNVRLRPELDGGSLMALLGRSDALQQARTIQALPLGRDRRGGPSRRL